MSVATEGRWLVRLGLNVRSWLDVDGEPLRASGKIVVRYRGHMIHVDVKKVGRAKTAGARAGYVYLHSAVDGSPGRPTPTTCRTRPPGR